MKTIFQCILLLAFTACVHQSHAQKIKDINAFFKDANYFFQQYAQDGRVKYSNLKNNQSTIQPLIDFIAEIPLSDVDQYKRKAYFINVYNLLVINSVVDKYPIPTVRDTDGFFKIVQHKVGGKMMTLDHLEYKIIFKEFEDARLHFVLVCAARGCPPIPSFAYTPGNLTEQINTQCQLALDNPSFLHVKEDLGEVHVSPIFKWYKDDFAPSVLTFINAHRTAKLPENYALSYYEYDWKLNTWDE